jgi:hypothetical protein
MLTRTIANMPLPDAGAEQRNLLRHTSQGLIAAAAVIAAMGALSAVSAGSLANCATLGAAEVALLLAWGGRALASYRR